LKRVEGLSKLIGREAYTDDLPLDGFLWGAVVRSPAPRGRIEEIRFGEGISWEEFVVVGADDIPGENTIFLMQKDQPVLAPGYVRHVHEPVLLLAHPSRDALRRAVRAVEVVVAPDPPALDFRVPPTPEQVQYGEDNALEHLHIEKGDVDASLATAPIVVEGVYETGSQEHVYLENQGMVAWLEDDTIVVKGSMQCPYYIVDAFTCALGLGQDQIRIIQAPTGGGFGGKEEYPSGVALFAALLTLKAGHPVKLIYERGEDMAATTKRHPSRIRHRTGVDENGRLLVQEIEVLIDGGAYVTLSPVVLSRAVIHAAGPYACANVRIDGIARMTNSVPFGAFRGFGAPQSEFAAERHMDAIAARLGMDPVELRRVNLLRDGQATATGQTIADGTDRVALMERALEISGYRAKRKVHAAFNASHPHLRRGMGLSTFFHGAGFTGSGEVHLASVVHAAGLADGRVEVRASSVEMGQGANTVFTQLAADRLGISPEAVVIAAPDTFIVPRSGPTVASRTTMVVGHLVEKACDDLRRRLGLGPATAEESGTDGATDGATGSAADGATGSASGGAVTREAIRAWHVAHPDADLIGVGTYEPPPGIVWDDENYCGDAYPTFAWASYVAEVEVDLRTYTTRVIDFVAVQEVGKVINETLARGQIQGGVVQAIGWSLLEDVRWKDGAMENTQLTNYIIPTSDDVPPIRVEFLENPFAYGAQGAKGIGELPMDGPGPAIAAAVGAATGTAPGTIPITPERLMEMMELREQTHA